MRDKLNFKTILENISQSVITTDLNGRVTFWNRASENIFGYTKEEMLNESLSKIYPDLMKNQFEENLKMLNNGKEINGQWKTVIKRGTKIWIDVNAKPVLADDGGDPVAIIASVHEIQDLKQIERELEENKARAQAILETTVNGIITVDEKGIIRAFNQAASSMFGYEKEEIVGRNAKILVPEYDWKEHDTLIRQYHYTGESQVIGFQRELTGQRKDGTLFPMELSVSLVQWKGKKLFTGVINDISERRKLEQEILRISEEERRRLGQDLHDGLGQMLTGIGLISQNLTQKLKTQNLPCAEDAQDIVDLIKDADKYAKALVHGYVQIEFEEDGLQAALNQLSSQAEKFLNVNCKFDSNFDINFHNPMKALNLYRIAQEAVNNAVKHGKAENIFIDLNKSEGTIVLSVKDDGLGFSQTQTQKNAKKNGMGLNIMKYRSKMMSGNLDILEVDDKTQVTCEIPYSNS